MSRFEEFWNLYPKKVGKKKAQESWVKAKGDDHADTIISHLKLRVRDDKKWRDGFVLDPTTFLNQERWTDEYEKIAPKRDTSKPMTVEVKAPWPQPNRWKAALNRLLLEVIQQEPHKSEPVWPTILEMRDLAAAKLEKQHGDRELPTVEWRPISEKALEWFLTEVREPGGFHKAMNLLKQGERLAA